MEWADEIRRLKVRTNADNPADSAQAVKFGAEGIGLCRTEHMFFEGDRIKAIREMIVSKTVEEREKALDKILPLQQDELAALGQFRRENVERLLAHRIVLLVVEDTLSVLGFVGEAADGHFPLDGLVLGKDRRRDQKNQHQE